MVKVSLGVGLKGGLRLWHFLATLIVFYGVLVVLLYWIATSGKYEFLQMAPLAGAIVGPTIAAFISIYLSVYSPQARATQKQGILTEIQISEMVRESRHSHYESKVKKFLEDRFPMDKIITSYQGRPFPGASKLAHFDLKKFGEDKPEEISVVKAHLEVENVGKRPFKMDELNSINERVNSYNKQVDELDVLLENAIVEEFRKESSVEIEKDDLQRTPTTGAILYLPEVINAVKHQWGECSTLFNGDMNRCVQEYFPQFGDLNRSQTVSYWSLKASNINWLDRCVARVDNSSLIKSIFECVKTIFLTNMLQGKFAAVKQKQDEILNYVEKVNDLAMGIVAEIDGKRYSKVSTCCPYPDIEIES